MKVIFEKAKEARKNHEETTCKRYILLYKKQTVDMERYSVGCIQYEIMSRK